MINTKKIINSSLKISNDIFKDLLFPLSKRIGFISGQSPIIPIFFYRYVGVEVNENEYYDKLYELDEKLSSLGNLYLKFTKNIPITRNDKIISKTRVIWEKGTSFNPSNRNVLIDNLISTNVLPILGNSLIDSSVQDSFRFIMDLYLNTEQNINLTKIKNFSLKFITWIDSFIPSLFKSVDYMNLKNEVYNPKILFYGDVKKHEVYFLIFLSRLGCDVLYINPSFDVEFEQIDRKGQFSKLHRLPKKGRIKEFSNKRTSKPKAPPVQIKNQSTQENLQNLQPIVDSKNIINISLKTSKDPFKDIFDPLNKRSGFISLPMPSIPIYFYRYIGIKESEDKYYNELFKLNKKLQNLKDQYIKFDNNIPLTSNHDLVSKTQVVWKDMDGFNISKKNQLVSLLARASVFPKFNDNLLDSSFVKGFSLVLDIFLKMEKSINLSRVKNFSLKILTWSHQFTPKLLKGFDYGKKSDVDVYNPKILYYGDIKKHEILFLILLSHLGCDIIYVNSFSDEAFASIEDSHIYSRFIEFPIKKVQSAFPREEKLLREETTAFKASREIHTIIHNEEDGVYRPWQFENYKTQPKTLKTTFDELKILWNETARMRGGFKIENGTVYIPNLFAKISGVHTDLNLYWKEIKDFKSSENTLFISKVPFTKVSFKSSDLYTCSYLINKDGLVDKKSLLQNKIYKFSYLKTPLQETIIEKINLFFKVPMLKKTIDKEFKLKILMTIMSIDKEILRLIQHFDYPAVVPKLIIYDNDESLFNDEDSIILSFLNLMGFDILILTPPGYNNIEQKIHEKYYDIHKLETVKFDLELPNLDSIASPKKEGSSSFWSGLFGSK